MCSYVMSSLVVMSEVAAKNTFYVDVANACVARQWNSYAFTCSFVLFGEVCVMYPGSARQGDVIACCGDVGESLLCIHGRFDLCL